MKQNQIQKTNKDKEGLASALSSIMSSWFGLKKLGKYKRVVVILLIVAFLIIVIGLFFGKPPFAVLKFLYTNIMKATEKQNPTANNFNKSDWELHLGNLGTDLGDPSVFILSAGSQSGLLQFKKNIPINSVYILEFIPLSENSANTIISVPETYEIIIGDGDYRTISLKASRGIHQGLYRVPDQERKRGNPKTDQEIRPGSSVTLKVSQELIEGGRLKIHLELTYLPKEPDAAIRQGFYATYVFAPSPYINTNPLNIDIGLISNKKSEIKTKFISFRLLD